MAAFQTHRCWLCELGRRGLRRPLGLEVLQDRRMLASLAVTDPSAGADIASATMIVLPATSERQYGVDGDFNDDGVYDCLDIDALIVQIAAGSHGMLFDLTQDGLVDTDDRDAWLAEAGAVNLGAGKSYLLGDANLDGVVDGVDFIIWNTNKFSPLPVVYGWCEGNFNGDGVVDGTDFIVWNKHRFESSDRTYANAMTTSPLAATGGDYDATGGQSQLHDVTVNNGTSAFNIWQPHPVPLEVEPLDAVFAALPRDFGQQAGNLADAPRLADTPRSDTLLAKDFPVASTLGPGV